MARPLSAGDVLIFLLCLLVVELLLRMRVRREVERRIAALLLSLADLETKMAQLQKSIEDYERAAVERFVLWKEDMKRDVVDEVRKQERNLKG